MLDALKETVTIAALVAAIVSLLTTLLVTFVRHWLSNRAIRTKLDLEYNYEQKKKLRDIVGRYHGLLINSSETLNHRIWNLYQNKDRDWLSRKDDGGFGYYLGSTLHRFLCFIYIIKKFESEAIFVDARIANDDDLELIKYCKIFEWVLTDIRLFEKLDYDMNTSRDHFYSDYLRTLILCYPESVVGAPDIEATRKTLSENQTEFNSVINFFENICDREERYRWDRLVVFHILLMCFLNRFGYVFQKTNDDQFKEVAGYIVHQQIANNALRFLPKFLLDRQAVTTLERAIGSAK